jgi:TonB family protein
MNKLMKFCGKCEEAFADRFAFCPNCGGELQTYELNPVADQPAAAAHIPQDEPVSTPVILTEAAAKDTDVLEIPEFEAVQSNGNSNGSVPESVLAQAAEPVAANTVNAVKAPPVIMSEPKYEVPPVPAATGDGWREVKSKSLVPEDDGMYHLTMVENKTFLNDPRLRATGIFALTAVFAVIVGGMVYDLFTQYVNVTDPMQEDLVMATFPIDPDASIEDIMEKIKVKDNNAAGGGGGGGGHDDDQPHQGNIPDMYKNKPDFPPTSHDRTMENPTMPINTGIQGPMDRQGLPDPGVPKGASKLSDGQGNGGIGMNGTDGIGRDGSNGYGSRGNGGIGNSPGTGIGDRTGDGVDGNDPPVMPRGPSKPMRITFQQKPGYTEAARVAQVNGTVRLRITFNANGTIGSISPVSQLGYGLTEQAISAARNMRFEPALKNGVPVTTARVVEFSFNIY